jgi:hypothetical protein
MIVWICFLIYRNIKVSDLGVQCASHVSAMSCKTGAEERQSTFQRDDDDDDDHNNKLYGRPAH